MIEYIVAGFALIFALVAVVLAVRAHQSALNAVQFCGRTNSRAKLSRVEADVTEIFDTLEKLQKLLRKINARTTMQDRREKDKSESTVPKYPDTPEGRDAERSALEAELMASGKLNPRIHQLGAK